MAKIKVHIQLFAYLMKKADKSRWVEEIEEGIRLKEIWNSIRKRYGFRELSEHILMAKNGEYASKETIAHDGDEIAFFPPVGGG